MYSLEQVLIAISLLVFISVVASKLSTKLGIPVLLFFLVIGMVASEELWGIVILKNLAVAKWLGTISLILVLFIGGLETDVEEIRPIIKSGFVVSTLGALFTALLVGFGLQWITGDYLTLPEALAVGAIVASTDAPAVFSILNARDMRLKANIGPLLELESGSNDVMVYFLMTFFLRLIKDPGTNFYMAIPSFFEEMSIGVLGGIFLGYSMLFMLNKIQLVHAGLYPVLSMSMLFLGYGVIYILHGSAFLTVYMGGMMLGNRDFIHKKSIIDFYKSIAWLMQITMFITLGLLVTPSELVRIASWGVQLSLLLMFIARPMSTFLVLSFSSFNLNQKIFISWVGLRGAVAIIFATYLYEIDQQKANMIFHLIFFVVLVSMTLQGGTLYRLAKWLKLEEKTAIAQKKGLLLESAEEVGRMFIQLEVPIDSPADGKPIVELCFPKNALIVLIYRDKRYSTARGSTIVKAEDKLLIMVDAKRDIKEVKNCLGIR